MKAPNFLDVTGQRFGFYTVVTLDPQKRSGLTHWICRCDCGMLRSIPICNLTSGNSKSCGCKKGEIITSAKTTHGMSGTTEYIIWRGIIQRCEDRQSQNYKKYGAKGIRICKRWRESFDAFYSDVGPRPSKKHSLDRFPDQYGDYEPGNVRWATASQQCRNRSTNRRVTINGKTKLLIEWSEEYGVPQHVLKHRIDYGWDGMRALTTPIRMHHHIITFDGKSMKASEWAKFTGIPSSAIRTRLLAGWSVEKALTVPSRGLRRKGQKVAT